MSVLPESTGGAGPATPNLDAVVMGAGPYGLSTAAHLRGRGLRVAIFGRPLELWSTQMPQGMLLRSYWWATNLSDPGRRYGLEQYFRAENQGPSDPFPIEAFIRYGLWFQRQAVPFVDETYVEEIAGEDRQFRVRLADGRVVRTKAVVMAPGLRYYAWRPGAFSNLPPALVTHTADHASFRRFAGGRVAVVGGGQSALETAALLNESGVQVELMTRSPIQWLRGQSMRDRTLWARLRAPKAGIAPGWLNWGLEAFPYAFQRLPRSAKDRLLAGRARYGPAGAHWLRDRILGRVTLWEGQGVEEIKEAGGGAMLRLSSGAQRKVDHVVLGTGYRVDLSRLPMLHSGLVTSVQTYGGAPVLSPQFESSVRGLYFVGFTAVASCGPLFRFVVGTAAAAHRVAEAIAGSPSRRASSPAPARSALDLGGGESNPLTPLH